MLTSHASYYLITRKNNIIYGLAVNISYNVKQDNHLI